MTPRTLPLVARLALVGVLFGMGLWDGCMTIAATPPSTQTSLILPAPAMATYQAAMALGNQGQYGPAIAKLAPLYKQYPTHPKIKRNLQTLYYNATAEAYQQDHLTQALALISPHWRFRPMMEP
jgi:outer membrane protein assembly factor BamD (BamD/ComL family)